MTTPRATIVQISDLHFGRQVLDSELLAPLTEAIKATQPSFLVVSGDIANNPRRGPMRKASRFINQLASECGIPAERVVTVPGNHDYKIAGNIGLRRISRVPYEMYFRNDCAQLGWWRRWLIDAKLSCNAILPWGKEMRDIFDEKNICYSDVHGVALLPFTSTPVHQQFGLATGKVESEQIRKTAAFISEKWDTVESPIKIAVVHHHPVPIAYVGTNLKERIQESFMVFFNAGTFLRELGRGGVDIVLHGHKHFGGFARVTYDLSDATRREISVLAAGSATHKSRGDPLGNEFNILRVYDDDTVTAEQVYFSATVKRKDESRSYVLRDIDDVRSRKKDRLKRTKGLAAREVYKRINLTPHGYTSAEWSLLDCTALTTDGVNGYDIDDSPAPGKSYIREYDVTHLPSSPKFLGFEPGPRNHFRLASGRITFGETKTTASGSFSFGYRYNLVNGHAVDYDEFARKYLGAELTWEYASLWCDDAVDSLKLRVEFAEDLNFDDIDLHDAEAVHLSWQARGGDSAKPDWNSPLRHNGESARIREYLSKHDRAFELNVPAPIPGFGYRIKWCYSSNSGARHNQLDESRLRFVRSRLIEEAQTASNRATAPYTFIQEYLGSLLRDVEKLCPACDPTEKLTISLAVFDDQNLVLRFVAASVGTISGLIDETFSPGEGCAGFSFEKGKVLFYDRARDTTGYFISPEEIAQQRDEPTAVSDHTALISVPWTENGIPVGVISIGSDSDYSRLLRVFDLTESDQQEFTDQLLALVHALGGAIGRALTDPTEEAEDLQDARSNEA